MLAQIVTRSAVGPKRKKEPKLFPGNSLGIPKIAKDKKDFLRLPKITWTIPKIVQVGKEFFPLTRA